MPSPHLRLSPNPATSIPQRSEDSDPYDHRQPTSAQLAAARSEFEYFGRKRAGTYAPLYARLGAAIADDDGLLALALRARVGQSRPDLLLAVVHDLLLGGADQRLARFYPSITAEPDPGDPVSDFTAFADNYRELIAERLACRLVQTNEVGRCAFLAPAIATAAARRPGTPLALLEVGTSAGLNLFLDRFGYCYDHTDGRSAGTGGPGSTTYEVAGDPMLHCELRGPGIPALTPFTVSWRQGIDLNPLDIADPEDRRWLRALVWPDHRERTGLLDSALTAALRNATSWDDTGKDGPGSYRLHAGDAAALLDSVVSGAPRDAHLVIYHSAVLAHMPDDERDRFTAAVLQVSRQRPVSWVQAEPRQDRDPRRLRLTECHDGRVASDVALGSYQPHGHWLQWE